MKNRLKIMEGTGDYMNKNQNIRFNMDKESDIMAWESLHSKDVGERFKSQNRFVIEAINYYYERVMRIQEDPYLETREKEDAFVERIVAQVAEKTLANLPTLAGMYLMQQQAVLTAGFQSAAAGANAGMPVMPSPANGNGNGRIKQGHTAEAVLGESAEEEPEDNEFLDYSFGV